MLTFEMNVGSYKRRNTRQIILFNSSCNKVNSTFNIITMDDWNPVTDDNQMFDDDTALVELAVIAASVPINNGCGQYTNNVR